MSGRHTWYSDIVLSKWLLEFFPHKKKGDDGFDVEERPVSRVMGTLKVHRRAQGTASLFENGVRSSGERLSAHSGRSDASLGGGASVMRETHASKTLTFGLSWNDAAFSVRLKKRRESTVITDAWRTKASRK
jgi:hypothetical protein